MVEASWSGEYPNLCNGEWKLVVNAEDVSDKIPKELKYCSMNTYGTYQNWHFEDWLEVFDSYDDGLDCEDWVASNKWWLNNITTNLEVQKEIYYAINSQDFRSGSCGGCV